MGICPPLSISNKIIPVLDNCGHLPILGEIERQESKMLLSVPKKIVDVIETIAKLDAAKYHYNTKMRDLRAKFEADANRLHSEYLDTVISLHGHELADGR